MTGYVYRPSTDPPAQPTLATLVAMLKKDNRRLNAELTRTKTELAAWKHQALKK